MSGHMAFMTSITCHDYQDGRDSGVQELKTFEHKARVCLAKHPVPSAVSLLFKCMIQLIGISGILNNSADRFKQIYVVELEAIGPVQIWRTKNIITC